MNTKSSATVGTYLVLFGIIVGIILLFSVAQGAAPFLKMGDKSFKSFNKLADKIEGLSLKGGGGESSEAVLIHMDSDEMLLFFDKNTGAFFYSFTTENPEDFNFFNENEFLNNLRHSGGEVLDYFYEKPARCGNYSCLVLCKNEYRIIKLQSNNINEYLAEKAPYIQQPPSKFLVIQCRPESIKILENIEKIRKKPHYKVSADNIEQARSYLEDLTFGLQYFFHGFYLSNSIPDFQISLKELNKRDLFMKEVNYIRENPPTYYLSELAGGEWTEPIFVLNNRYIYLESYGKNLFMCYQPPCISLEDKIYLHWEKHLNTCLELNDCGSFLSAINNYAVTGILTFSTGDNNLYLRHGGYNFPFDEDVDLKVKELFDDEKEPFKVSKLSIEKVELYEGDVLKLEANNNEYWLFDISSPADTEQEAKPGLIFKVNEWVFGEEDGYFS